MPTPVMNEIYETTSTPLLGAAMPTNPLSEWIAPLLGPAGVVFVLIFAFYILYKKGIPWVEKWNDRILKQMSDQWTLVETLQQKFLAAQIVEREERAKMEERMIAALDVQRKDHQTENKEIRKEMREALLLEREECKARLSEAFGVARALETEVRGLREIVAECPKKDK